MLRESYHAGLRPLTSLAYNAAVRYLFISDLHLDASAPAAVEAFIAFTRGTARAADALYILGDLFEVWIGDDDTDPTRDRVCAALRELTAAGVAVFVMQGNRDFLYGERFEARTGCTLLPDPVVAHLGGERVLLTHGDLLCTGDTAYQELRTTVRDPRFRDRALALPLEARQWIADTARSGSKAHTRTTAANIMDVTPAAVEAAFRASGCLRMIHGHTHRPATHAHTVDGAKAERWVLAAWDADGSALEVSEHGWRVLPANPQGVTAAVAPSGT
jgi:UDP-2,3-diacylglucosamine hydrolase